MRKNHLAMICVLVLSLLLWGCGNPAATAGGYGGIDVPSPEWVGKLDAAKDVEQMLIVAAFSEDATDAWVSLH